MKCHNDTGKCMHKPKCAFACNLRIQPVERALSAQDDEARPLLHRIGQQIGYGNAQHILGALWDEMLQAEYQVPPGRGQMGVTAGEAEAYKRGWGDCMKQWATHMTRMAKAIKT